MAHNPRAISDSRPIGHKARTTAAIPIHRNWYVVVPCIQSSSAIYRCTTNLIIATNFDYIAVHTAQAPSLRELLLSKPRLATILRSIDTLRGVERERALEQVLLHSRTTTTPAQGTRPVWTSRPPWLPPGGTVDVDEEDMLALEQFAATIERILAECDLERDREQKGLAWE